MKWKANRNGRNGIRQSPGNKRGQAVICDKIERPKCKQVVAKGPQKES